MEGISQSTSEVGTSLASQFALVAIGLIAACVCSWLALSLMRRLRRYVAAKSAAKQASSAQARDEAIASLPPEFVAASTVGSDYYVPSSDEFKDAIKTNIFDRQRSEALRLARELVVEYRRLMESGEATSVYCVIANPLVKDYNVMKLCEEILKHRGWSVSNFGDGKVHMGPSGGSQPCSFSSSDLLTVVESESCASLIANNITAPRKALALSLAKQLVDGYLKELGEEKPTSQVIAVTVEKEIDHNVFTEVENILAPRGWAVSYFMHNSYHVWPTPKRDRPARHSGGMIII